MKKRYEISDITKTRLIALIKKSITNNPIDYSIFKNMAIGEWKELIFISKIHTIEAIVFEEILKFESDILPPHDICIQMFAEIERVKSQNKLIYKTISELQTKYNELNLDFLIFKGPICGINYPNPLLRCIGDIDIFLYKYDDFAKANSWAISSGFKYHKDELKLGHWTFEYNNILIENHNNITFFEKKKYNERFDALINDVLSNRNFHTLDIGELKIDTLPIEINYIYIFLHLFYHFVHGGVGFRQYMDWIYFGIRYSKNMDTENITKLCEKFDIVYPISIFANIAINTLGVSADSFPFTMSKIKRNDYDIVLDDIIQCGNFGILNTDYWKGKWSGRLHKFLKTIRRSIKLYKISPEYSSSIPFYTLYARIYLSLIGK